MDGWLPAVYALSRRGDFNGLQVCLQVCECVCACVRVSMLFVFRLCGEAAAKRMTGLFCPRSASLGLSGPMYTGLSTTVASFITNSHIGIPLFCRALWVCMCVCMYVCRDVNPKKRHPKGSWSNQSKKWPTHILGSRFFEGPQIPKKGLQKAPGRPKPKSGQFYQQLTDWEASQPASPPSA